MHEGSLKTIELLLELRQYWSNIEFEEILLKLLFEILITLTNAKNFIFEKVFR